MVQLLAVTRYNTRSKGLSSTFGLSMVPARTAVPNSYVPAPLMLTVAEDATSQSLPGMLHVVELKNFCDQVASYVCAAKPRPPPFDARLVRRFPNQHEHDATYPPVGSRSGCFEHWPAQTSQWLTCTPATLLATAFEGSFVVPSATTRAQPTAMPQRQLTATDFIAFIKEGTQSASSIVATRQVLPINHSEYKWT